MPPIGRPLLFFVACASALFVMLPGSRAASGILPPMVVEAYDPLPSVDSLASLLVAVDGGARDFHRSAVESALMIEMVGLTQLIRSGSSRADALIEIASVPDLGPEVVSALAETAERVTPSSARARVLRTVIRRQPEAAGGARGGVLKAIRTLGGSERVALLELFVSRPGIDHQALADAFALVSRLSSASERSRVMVAAARANRIDGPARSAYMRLADGMSARRDRARALAALGARPKGTGR